MKKFLAIYQKVGGREILRQYRQNHVFCFALRQTLSQGFSKKGLELVRLSVNHKILRKLRKKYRKTIARFREQYTPQPQKRSNKVWVCWLQGMQSAPALVQACYASLQKHLSDREIILLTEENHKCYVNFPAHIQQKIDSGIISKTHFSDLLRLELLINHGGTWVDATVFCSGGQIPGYMLDSDLFLYQALKPGLDGHPTCISSWFMTACTNHPILLLTRRLLYAYWEKNKKLSDYFLLHDCFQLAIETYPREWERVIPMCNSLPHILLLRLFEPYDAQVWLAVQNATPFHKLTYKFTPEDAQKEGTYYAQLFGGENYGTRN